MVANCMVCDIFSVACRGGISEKDMVIYNYFAKHAGPHGKIFANFTEI